MSFGKRFPFPVFRCVNKSKSIDSFESRCKVRKLINAHSGFSVAQHHFLVNNGKKKRLPPEDESLCNKSTSIFPSLEQGFTLNGGF